MPTELELLQLLTLSLVGIATGWLNVVAGGGSLLSVPALLFMGLPAPVANGTNRIAILLQNVMATWTFFRQGLQDFKLSFSLSAMACIGALSGANVGVQLQGVWFDRLLALVMLLVLLSMLFQNNAKHATDPGPIKIGRLRYGAGHAAMLLVGFWGGLIQIGVGFILMPVLQRMFALDLVRVNAHKVFIVASYTLVALVVFAAQIDIAWEAGIALAVGTVVGGWLGAHSSIRQGQAWIRRVFLLCLIAMIGKLLLG
ncbi:MAG: hypothetical protein CSA60_04165 [Neptuniibacter caesariensis]|uniref:Probable membrane transporter protein n=1 Tax=Neptuniibacter caesariensis TaxID=207954 RepID=A0A2G6JJJ6_NEPCE|nr:MAG: hypothetical protein CSA60_04165 [Neptuniibacter caesariensis]